MQLITDSSPTLIDRPQTFEEMSAREGFQAPIDHTEHVLKAVLSEYHFQRQALCGLKACRTPHNHGFLVITESGIETNIGQYCGRTHFGEEIFHTLQADHQRLRERADLTKRARDLQASAPSIEARINAFMNTNKFGAMWLTKVRAELYALIGSSLESLEVAQQRGELTVKEYRQRTEEEIENLMAANKGLTRAMARDATAVVGTLEPMPWIMFDCRGRLITGLLRPLLAFAVQDPNQIASPKLKDVLKSFDGHARTLDEADAAAASALRFLSEENLRLLALWLPPHLKAKADLLRDWIGSEKHANLLNGAI
ncbi:hypothetical protein J2789_001913 [Variovorax paradoxus]|uniref:hypothetical protein n=1 Tax=Variovorax atrisoli TaxID=3394203 RepID=UPI00119A99F9|nr:hypothetical protein [Variovorax paradoxus]MDR6519231.1 hypothetical protein [Variovorax paradoxus]